MGLVGVVGLGLRGKRVENISVGDAAIALEATAVKYAIVQHAVTLGASVNWPS